METAPTTTEVPEAKIRLYPASEYMFLGLLFSLIPVYVMSFANSKVLPSGAMIRSALKKSLAAFVIFMMIALAVDVWAANKIVTAAQGALANNTHLLLQTMISPDRTASIIKDVIPEEYKTAITIAQNFNYLIFGGNILLLIITTRFLSKYEIPEVKAIKEKGLMQTRPLLVPVMAGLAFVAFIIWGWPILVEYILRVTI